MEILVIILTIILTFEWVVALDNCEKNIGRALLNTAKISLFVIILKMFAETIDKV